MRIVKVATLTLMASAVLLLLALAAHAEQYPNFALTTLATSIGSGDTTLTVAATTNFPTTPTFRIIIQDSISSTPEIAFVTGVSGSTYTVTRGYEGTTVTAHSAGAQVGSFVTGGVITDIYSKISGVQPAGTNGQIQFNNNGVPGGFTANGDCTVTPLTGAYICTKTNSVSFAPSATTDTTNAANISSGTLPAARLPNPSATTLGGIQSLVGAAHQWISSISTSGAPSTSRPACADLSDSTASCATDATNASNIGSGTLPAARLPTPSPSALGGIQSFAATSHQWINAISTSGVPSASQPAASDVSGLAPSATTDTTNAANITSGTLASAQLPIPTGAGASGVPNCVGFTSVALCEKALGYSDVRLHGANCNGGNDAVAINATLTAANTGGWKTIKLPHSDCMSQAEVDIPADGMTIMSDPQSTMLYPQYVDGARLYFNSGYSGYSSTNNCGLNINGHSNTKLVNLNIFSDGAETGIANICNSVTYTSGDIPILDMTNVSSTRGGTGIGCSMPNVYTTPGSNPSGACTAMEGNLITLRCQHCIFNQNGWGARFNMSDAFLDVNSQVGGNACGGIYGTTNSDDMHFHNRFDQNGGGTTGTYSYCSTANWASLTIQGKGAVIDSQFELANGPGLYLGGNWAHANIRGHFADNGKSGTAGKDANIIIAGTAGGTLNRDLALNASFFTYGGAPKYNVELYGASGYDNSLQIHGTMPSISYTTSAIGAVNESIPSEFDFDVLGQPVALKGRNIVVGQYGAGAAGVDFSALSTGVLMPNIATASRPTCASGLVGEVYYDTTANSFVGCQGSSPAWSGLGSSVSWPTSGNVVISNGTNTPSSVAPVNGNCLIGSGGNWVAGSCSGTTVISPAIAPTTMYPNDTSGSLFPNFYAGAGGNAAAYDYGMGVVASLASDKTWVLRFPIPSSVPTGTMKLRIVGLANASSGTAKFTVNDAVVAAGASPSAASLTAETQSTVTWAAGDADKYKETKLVLTPSASSNGTLVVALTFNTSGFTLAANSTWVATLIWE